MQKDLYPVSGSMPCPRARMLYGGVDTEFKILRAYPLTGYAVIESPEGSVLVKPITRLRYVDEEKKS